MALDLDNTTYWTVTGGTVDTLNVFTEDATETRHMVTQDVQNLVDAGLGTTATMRCRIEPRDRTRFWMGARANNNLYMASFDTATTTMTSNGANVSSGSIINNGDGTYTATIHFNGTYSASNTVFAVGALIDDAAQTYTGTSAEAFKLHETWLCKGSTEFAYSPTTDRTTYADLETGDGSQDVTLPGSNIPETLEPLYITSAGDDALTISDFTEDLDALTVCAFVKWDGTTGAEMVMVQHWETAGNQRSWRSILDTSGKFKVELSSNGTAVEKSYVAVDALDSNEWFLCTFTWDGSDLKMYINDTELTTGASELTKTTDSALSGDIHNSTADLEELDAFYGDCDQIRIYTGAASATEVSAIAGALGVTGLPDGTGGGTPSWPADNAAMVTWLAGKGISSGDIRYVDKDHGSASDSNAGTSSSAPWATIQKAADTLTAGMAVIIADGGRYYEAVEPGNSGTAGNLIWYVSPGDGAIFDGRDETALGGTWTNTTGNEWRRDWGLTRYYRESTSYSGNCTSGATCLDAGIWKGVGIAHGTTMLKRRDGDGGDGPDGPGVPTLNQGDCYFEVGTGSQTAPQYVHVRLASNADPNGESMYSFSDRKYAFDWQSSAHHADGFYGGDNETELEDGRSYIGLGGLHFKYHTGTKKTGPTAVRGTGWHVEHCSFSQTNSHGLGIHGHDHTITDCYFYRNGLGAFLMEYADGIDMSFCKFQENNLHNYPTNWSSGSKISYSGKNTRCDLTDLYVKDDYACPFWWDIDNFNASTGESFLFKRIFINGASRQGFMVERKTRHVIAEDIVVFGTNADTSGNADQRLGSGMRSQAASDNRFLRNVYVNCDGHGFFDRAWDDSRSTNNNNDIDYLALIMNGADATVDQNPSEMHVGDGKGSTGDLDTTTANNVVVSNSRSGVASFRDDSAGTETDTAATAEGWFEAGSGDFVVDDTPSNIVSDYTSETGCYDFTASYINYKPLFTNGHPKDHVTWSIPA